MAEAVRAAFAASENLMVEAGTGVGKSMAYLDVYKRQLRADSVSRKAVSSIAFTMCFCMM